MYRANYIPLLNEIKLEIRKLATHPLLWVGRINIVKMVILSKILYKFQTIPIALPQTFFPDVKDNDIKMHMAG